MRTRQTIVKQTTPSSSGGRHPLPTPEKNDIPFHIRVSFVKLHDVKKYLGNVYKLRPKVYSASKVDRSLRKYILDGFLKTVSSASRSKGSKARSCDTSAPTRRPRKQVRRDPATVTRREYAEDEWWRMLVVPDGGEPVLRLFREFQQGRGRTQ